ncbi:tyrosine-type recombinase/integrase [Viridibacillus sp. NPDC093762]|uniref:tyrosine-type recombinase/integrase n=1 Tax=Viridibacillus sp. NPDC093762 TaxID=3390720 RepID=UPI003D009F39
MFEFMFPTGCRIGEIVSLEKYDINWSNRSAVVRGKGDKEREVYFNIRSKIWHKRYIDNRNDTDPATLSMFKILTRGRHYGEIAMTYFNHYRGQ